MATTQNGIVQVDGGKLYYEMTGKGETVVFVHAGFVDSGMWDGQFEAFAKHFRVIRFDMRGYGKSDMATGPVCRRMDLYEVMKELGIEKAHFIGCSMGGEVVIDLAIEHPELAQSLTVISAVPSGFGMQGEPPPFLFEMMGAVQAGNLETASELQIRIWVDGMFRDTEQVDPAVRERASQMNLIAVKNGTWMVADSQPLNPLDPPAIGRLGEISVPTLILAGALDHPEILRAGDVMESAIENAKKVIIENTAHVPTMEKVEECNRVMLDFLSL